MKLKKVVKFFGDTVSMVIVLYYDIDVLSVLI